MTPKFILSTRSQHGNFLDEAEDLLELSRLARNALVDGREIVTAYEEAAPRSEAAVAARVAAISEAANAVPVPTPGDPWAHRSAKMKCATCMWWVQKGDSQLGRCRRHAPTMGGYPAAYASDWCGDHKLDEAKA